MSTLSNSYIYSRMSLRLLCYCLFILNLRFKSDYYARVAYQTEVVAVYAEQWNIGNSTMITPLRFSLRLSKIHFVKSTTLTWSVFSR
jgi:hypothetical protein